MTNTFNISGNNNKNYLVISSANGEITVGTAAPAATTDTDTDTDTTTVTLAQLSYTKDPFDLLRNSTVDISAVPDSEYSTDFKVTNATNLTNFVSQWSTKGAGISLELVLTFSVPVIVSRILLRQRMMSNGSSMMSDVDISIPGGFDDNLDLGSNSASDLDPVYSPLYEKYFADDNTVTWGLQKQFTQDYTTFAPITRTISIKAGSLISYTGSGSNHNNTGLADLQIMGLKYPDFSNVENVVKTEPSKLFTWPMTNLTDPSGKWVITNYQSDLPTLKVVTGLSNDSIIKSNNAKAYPANFHVCNLARNFIALPFTNVMGLPGALDASFASDVSNGDTTWEIKYDTWKSRLTTDFSGTDLSFGQAIADLIDILRYVFTTEVNAGLGHVGVPGAGTKWIGNSFFENDISNGVGGLADISGIPDVSGIPAKFTPLVQKSKTISEKLTSFLTDHSNNTHVQDLCANMDIIGRPLGNTFNFVQEQAVLVHVQTMFSMVRNTGLTDKTKTAIEAVGISLEKFFYPKPVISMNDVNGTIPFQVSVSKMNNGNNKIDSIGRWIGTTMPASFDLCSTAQTLLQVLRNIKWGLDGGNFSQTPQGQFLIRALHEMLTTERQLRDGVKIAKITYPFSVLSYHNDTAIISRKIGLLSKRLNSVASSGDLSNNTAITQQTEANILWHNLYIWSLHLPIINNDAKKQGVSFEFFNYLTYSDGYPIDFTTAKQDVVSAVAAGGGQYTDALNRKFTPIKDRSRSDGIFMHIDDTVLAQVQTKAGTDIIGLASMFDADRK